MIYLPPFPHGQPTQALGHTAVNRVSDQRKGGRGGEEAGPQSGEFLDRTPMMTEAQASMILLRPAELPALTSVYL